MVWPKYDVKDLEIFDVIFPVSLKCSVRRLLALAMPSFRLLALMDISQDGAHCFGLEIHEQLELEWGGGSIAIANAAKRCKIRRAKAIRDRQQRPSIGGAGR